MRTKCFFWILVSMLLVSCASTKFEGKAVLMGKVCDMDGKPVPDYHLNLGIGMNAVTDSAGIFVFRDVSSGFHKLSGGGDGWKNLCETVDFHDRKTIFCVQVERIDSLLDEILPLVEEKKYADARKLLANSRQYNEKNPSYKCLCALIDFCESPSEKTKKSFDEMLEKI